ncbi:hypothetical protein OY671_011452, partial [Metschnikowia pulcherrima]
VFQYQIAHFPKGKSRWKAELEIGNSYSDETKCNDAIPHYDKVVAGAPKDQRVLASFAKASCYEEMDDLDSAYELFSQIKDDYPSPQVEAMSEDAQFPPPRHVDWKKVKATFAVALAVLVVADAVGAFVLWGSSGAMVSVAALLCLAL